jgi:hypothetical protein
VSFYPVVKVIIDHDTDTTLHHVLERWRPLSRRPVPGCAEEESCSPVMWAMSAQEVSPALILPLPNSVNDGLEVR